MKIKQEDGSEIEVFTAEEVTARETAVRTAVEGELKPQLSEAQQKLADAQKAAGDRAREFGEFRKLSEEQIAKLSEAERIIYENGVLLQAEREKNVENAKTAHEGAVTAAIRSKVGTDQKVLDKVQEMYKIIALDDTTPEGIAARVAAAVGALGQTEPDLLASVGLMSGGSFEPPKRQENENSFADTERGKEIAAGLGLMTELPKNNS